MFILFGQDGTEHGLFCIFTTKMRLLLIKKSTKEVQTFTIGNIWIQTKLNMTTEGSIETVDIRFQVHLGAKVTEIKNTVGKINEN